MDLVLKFSSTGVASPVGDIQKLTDKMNAAQRAGAGLSRAVSTGAGAVKGFATSLAGMVGLGALTQLGRETLSYAGRVQDLSDALGVGVEELQGWIYAADQSGASIDQISAAFKRMSLAQAAANDRSKEHLAAFAAFGISAAMLRSTAPDRLFKQLAEAIRQAAPSADTLSNAMRLLGRDGASVLPAMRNGFSAMADEARRAGYIIRREVIEELDAAGDKLARAKFGLRATAAPGVAGIAGAVDYVLRDIAKKWAFVGAMTVRGTSMQEAWSIAGKQVAAPEMAKRAALPAFPEEQANPITSPAALHSSGAAGPAAGQSPPRLQRPAPSGFARGDRPDCDAGPESGITLCPRNPNPSSSAAAFTWRSPEPAPLPRWNSRALE